MLILPPSNTITLYKGGLFFPLYYTLTTDRLVSYTRALPRALALRYFLYPQRPTFFLFFTCICLTLQHFYRSSPRRIYYDSFSFVFRYFT